MKHARQLSLFAVAFLAVLFITSCGSNKQLFISTFVPEEGGVNFVKITGESSDFKLVPIIRRDATGRLTWWANPFFDIDPDGFNIAYQTYHNNNCNIYVRNLSQVSGAQQRTFQGGIGDQSYSPDGKSIVYTKQTGNFMPIYITSASQGSVMQQISTPNTSNYGPRFTPDGKKLFFSRSENGQYAIWSYDMENAALAYYCYGMSPFPINEDEFLCVRRNSQNNYEIWRINHKIGSESIILSMDGRSFTTPSLSPDGKWIVCVSNTLGEKRGEENCDIYVVRIDGSQLTQLTYHKGHDLSPVWGRDGKSIYFLSQRGTEDGTYNIWKMSFNLY